MNTSIILAETTHLADTALGKYLDPLKSVLTDEYRIGQDEDVFAGVFRTEMSTHYGEGYAAMNALRGNFSPTGEGGTYPNAERSEGYNKTINNIVWKLEYPITREWLDDGQISKMKQTSINLVQAFWLTKNKLKGKFFEGAVLGSGSYTFEGRTFGTIGADGVNLFSTAHPSSVDATVTQSNMYAPEADMAAGTFVTKNGLLVAEAIMKNVKDDNGDLINIQPDTIIIGQDPALLQQICDAIGIVNQYVPTGTAGAITKSVSLQYGRFNIKVIPFLNPLYSATVKPFFMFDSRRNEQADGLIEQVRVPLEISFDKDKSNDNFITKGYARFALGNVDWREIFAFNITGGSVLSLY